MNPYTIEESPTTHWCAVVAHDGRVVAHCPTKEIAESIAAALWESAQRVRGCGEVGPEYVLGGEG